MSPAGAGATSAGRGMDERTDDDQPRQGPAFERWSVGLAEIEEALARRAASASPSRLRRRMKRVGTDAPVGQINIRAEIADLSAFVTFCEEHRLPYREGFGRLVKLIPLAADGL